MRRIDIIRNGDAMEMKEAMIATRVITGLYEKEKEALV